MYTFWGSDIGPVTLKSSRGNLIVFPDFREAVIYIRNNHIHIVDHPIFSDTDPDRSWSTFGRVDHVLLDQHGLIIPLWRINEVLAEIGPRPLPRYAYRRWGNYDPELDFRSGPVPGTGHKRFRYSRYLRHMRTFGEIRDMRGLEEDLRDAEDFPVRVKIRNRRKSLPTLWDDFYKETQRSWKKSRKTQWK